MNLWEKVKRAIENNLIRLSILAMLSSCAWVATGGGEGAYFSEEFEGKELKLVEWAGDHEKKIEAHDLSSNVFHSGKQSEHIRIVYGNKGARYDYWRIKDLQPITLTPGMMLEISAWVKADRPMDIRVSWAVKGGKKSGVITGGRYSGNGAWEEIRLGNIEEQAFSQAEAAQVDVSQGLAMTVIGFNLYGFSEKQNIDLYVDEIRIYTRIPLEIEGINREKSRIARMLSADGTKKYAEDFEELYEQLDDAKKILAETPDGATERVAAQKLLKDIFGRYKRMKMRLALAVLE